MNNHGATVTPNISFDPQTGEEVIDYENSSIAWAGDREQILQDFDRHQDELLSINEFNGDVEHEYNGQHSADFLAGTELPPADYEQLTGIVGGNEAYQSLMQWASNNLNSEVIDQFDQIMSSSDFPEMEEAITQLYAFYLENYQSEYYEEESEEEEEFDPAEQEAADIQFNQDALSHYGEDNYANAIQFAAQNWSQADIEAYDAAMDSPDHEYKQNMIMHLMDQYQTYN